MPHVYDDQETEQERAQQEGAHDSLGVHPERQEAEVDSLNKAFDAPAIRDQERNPRTSSAADDANKDEEEKLGKGFTSDSPDDDEGAPKNRRSLFSKTGGVIWGSRRRRTATILAATIGLTGVFGSLMLSLTPLKLVHITQNLQDYFFSAGESAVEKSGEKLLTNYLIKQVMPGMVDGGCSSTLVEKSCAKTHPGTNPVGQLYNAWRDANLEGKLASKYGIEIRLEVDGSRSTFYLRAPGIDADGVRLGTANGLIDSDGNLFEAIESRDRNQVRRLVRSSFADETLFKRTIYKYQVGKLLAEKYGITRCIFACDLRDGSNEWIELNVNDKKRAGRGILTKFVVARAGESTSLIFECALSGFVCANYGGTESDGTRSTAYERDLRSRVITTRASLSPTELEDLFKDIDIIKNNGMSAYLIEKIVQITAVRLGVNVSTGLVADAVPYVGWVLAAVQIIGGVANAGDALTYLSYAHVATVYADQFNTYRSAADELKAGRGDAALIGSLTETLSGEGGFNAEQAPLYQEIMPSGTTSIASIISPKTYAANGVSTVLTEVCDEEPQPGKVVCPNESVETGPDSNIAKGVLALSSGVNAVLNNMPMGSVIQMGLDNLATFMNWFGSLATKALELLKLDGLVAEISERIGNIALIRSIMTYVSSVLIQNPFADEPNAVNSFNTAAGGADVIANDLARDEYGLGTMSDSEVVAIRNEYLQEKKNDFMRQPLFARLFDKENTYSAISQLALAAPSFTTGSFQSYASAFMSNPFGSFESLLGSMLFGNKARAGLTEDPFGIQQYGLPDDHPLLTTDPEVYWEENDCSNPDQAKNWADEYGIIDPDSKQFEITETNGCKLLFATISATGGLYDSSLLPKESTSSDVVNPGSAGAVVIDGNAWPVDIGKSLVSGNAEPDPTKTWTCDTATYGCHYKDSLHAIDLADYRTRNNNRAEYDGYTIGKAIFAIADGTMDQVKNGRSADGCYSFHITTTDGYDYFYTHTQSPIISPGAGNSKQVKAGEQVAVIGERRCTGNNSYPHLHIDRAPKGEINYGTSSRDPLFDAFIVKLRNSLQ